MFFPDAIYDLQTSHRAVAPPVGVCSLEKGDCSGCPAKNGCLQPNMGAVGKFINLPMSLHLAVIINKVGVTRNWPPYVIQKPVQRQAQ